MSADPWRAPDPWHVTVSTYQPPDYPPVSPLIRWPHDVVVAVLTTALVTLAGSVAGLVWSATSPKLSISAVLAGSEATFKSQVADDGRFLLIGVAAGIVCAAVVLLFRQRGPGAVVGLAVGGVLAAIVANRVGMVAQHDATFSALHSLGISDSARVVDLLGFKVRAQGVLLGWPLAAVVVHGLAIMLHPDGR